MHVAERPQLEGSALFKGLWSHRFLLVTLVRRNFQLRYRQTAAGFGWSIVPPLATVAMATLVFGKVIGVDSGDADVPYPAFAIAALAPWTFFSNCLSAGVPSVVQSSQMITRLAFPRSVVPFSMIGVSLVDLAIGNVILFGFLLITGFPIPGTAVWFPLLLLIEVALVTGVVLLASALNVFARDLKLGLPLFTQLWLLLTPVMYPLSDVGELRSLYLLNPMTGLVESFREVLLYGRAPTMELLAPSLIGALVLVAVGSWYFSVVENRFADAL
jgi:lipopolysaccharide transport system permease protein